ncbi:MAG: alpha/beta fold hydrolase [Acidimicrobiales bacterium]
MTTFDRRTLCWAEFGPEAGRPVMFFHGGNDSRLAGSLLEAEALAIGVRLICPERPGFGRSTFQPGRGLLDWSSDVEQLADRLDLGWFGIVGHSGGGPHALACAAALPERVARVATVSSVAPPPATNRGLHPMFRVVNALMNHPTLYRTVARSQLRQMSKHADHWLRAWAKMQPADGAMFREQPRIAAMVLAEMTEAVQAGPAGLVHEASLYHRNWGFELSAIQTTTTVWHGASDRQATPAWAHFLADNIPSASLTLLDGAGHFSTLLDNAATILTELATPNTGAENRNDLP